MNNEHELLLENYNLIYRLKEQADNLRKESDMLLSGMRQILIAKDSAEIYEKMFAMFQAIIPYHACFLIEPVKPGFMQCKSYTHDKFKGTTWEVDSVIKKALSENPVAIFNVATQPAWKSNAQLIENTKSVLYCPLKVTKHTSVIVFCSEEIGFYTQNHVHIAERYREYAEQAVLSVEAKLSALESETLKQQKADAERSLLESEKMASLGMLAAGIAHEINNPIAFVKANVDFLTQAQPGITKLIELCSRIVAGQHKNDAHFSELRFIMDNYDLAELPEDFSDICRSTDDGISRVTEIISSLRSFTRKDELTEFDINECIENSLRLVGSKFAADIELHTDLSKNLPPIKGSASKFNQVIVNLLVNASQAVNAKGRVWVKSDLKNNDIVVSVKDNGCGIPESALCQIFEPFYTTKNVGEGTGLGLYITFQIIDAMGGKISVESELNMGTGFTITLPVYN